MVRTREALVNAIADHLNIQRPLISTGATVDTDFLDAIASGIGLEKPSGNAYRRVESLIIHLGGHYDSRRDTSEWRGITGGGTITNFAWRKICALVTGRSFLFYIPDDEMRDSGQSFSIPIGEAKSVTQAIIESLPYASICFRSSGDKSAELQFASVFKVLQDGRSTRILFKETSSAVSEELVVEIEREIGSKVSMVEVQSWSPLLHDEISKKNEESDRKMSEENSNLPEEFEVDITPDANSLRNYQAMDFTPWYAIGEFIDNSITSAMRDAQALKAFNQDFTLRIDIDFDERSKSLRVKDNAAGIPKARIGDALTSGKTATVSSIGLGRYGVGMKAAAFWWGSKLEVTTYPLGEAAGSNVTIDISGEDNVAAKVRVSSIVHNRSHGTTVEVHDLWKRIPAAKTVTKIKSYLPSIYREYLGLHTHEGVELECEIYYQGEKLEYKEPALLKAPFWADRNTKPSDADEVIFWKKDVKITLPSGAIASGWVGILEKMSRDLSGLVLKYKGKIVVGAAAIGDNAVSDESTSGMFKPKDIFGQAGSAVNQTIIGEFDIVGIPKTLTTNGFQWSDVDRDYFIEELKKELSEGENAYLAMARNYRRRWTTEKPEVDVKKQDEKERDAAHKDWDQDIDHNPVPGGVEDVPAIDPDDLEGHFELSLIDNEGHNHKFKLTLVGNPNFDLFKIVSRTPSEHLVYVNLNHAMFNDITDEALKRLMLQKIFMTMALAIVLEGSVELNAFVRKFNNEAKKRNRSADE
jgi:hypothetical protein